MYVPVGMAGSDLESCVSDKQYYGSEWITDMWESGNGDCWPTTGLGSLCSSPTLPAQSGPPIPAHGYLQVEVQGHLRGLATRGLWLQLAVQ